MTTPKTIEEKLETLESIVTSLDDGSLTLNESLSLFESGIGLIKQCQEILNQAEQKIEVLVEKNNGEITLEVFE